MLEIDNPMNFCYRTDAGLYNCVATRSLANTYNYNRSRRETVYMDINVSPRYNPHITPRTSLRQICYSR